MPITHEVLRRASLRWYAPPARTVYEAKARGIRTVFLCHSHLDAVLVRGLVTLLQESGWDVYVDWEDQTMPPRPSRETAAILKQRIEQADFFLFLVTQNSLSSRWCPWELGYADGTKPIDSILVCPTYDGSTTHGNEYVDLYRRIDLTSTGRLAVWNPGQSYYSAVLPHW